MAASLEIFPSRSGAATARLGEVLLHSRFDPEQEARRFAEGLADARCLVLIGPCLNHVGKILSECGKRPRILSIQLSAEFRGREVHEPREAWYPDRGERIESFILSRLSARDLWGLKVASWRPAMQAWPEEGAAAERAVRSALRSLNGSMNALNRFGARKAVNACRNALRLSSVLAPCPRPLGTVIVCASGPSLEAALPLLRRLSGRIPLCALSSALRPLDRSGIRADFCLTSDPGWWAGHHLRWLPSGTPLLAPLHANLGGRVLSASPLLVLDEEDGLDGRIISEAALPALRVPAAGTVSATALRACLELGWRRVVFAGLDLCAPSMPSHARPNAHDEAVTGSCGRLRPAHSLVWERESAAHPLKGPSWRSSLPLDTYAEHFSRLAAAGLEFYRLGPSTRVVDGLEDISAEELEAQAAAETALPFGPAAYDATGALQAVGREADWLADASSRYLKGLPLEEADEEELSSLLFSATMALRKARSGEWADRLDEAEKSFREQAERLIARMESAMAGAAARGPA